MKQETERLEKRLEMLQGELLKRQEQLQDRAHNFIGSALAIVGPDMRTHMMLMSDPAYQRLQDEIVKAEGELLVARIADTKPETEDPHDDMAAPSIRSDRRRSTEADKVDAAIRLLNQGMPAKEVKERLKIDRTEKTISNWKTNPPKLP